MSDHEHDWRMIGKQDAVSTYECDCGAIAVGRWTNERTIERRSDGSVTMWQDGYRFNIVGWRYPLSRADA